MRTAFYFVVILAIFALLFFTFQDNQAARIQVARSAYARNDIKVLCMAMAEYIDDFKTPPSGDRVKIISILQGNNPDKRIFLDVAVRSINSAGEFVDPWGSPYSFGIGNDGTPWVYSYGRDMLDEGGRSSSDDICSWQFPIDPRPFAQVTIENLSGQVATEVEMIRGNGQEIIETQNLKFGEQSIFEFSPNVATSSPALSYKAVLSNGQVLTGMCTLSEGDHRTLILRRQSLEMRHDEGESFLKTQFDLVHGMPDPQSRNPEAIGQ